MPAAGWKAGCGQDWPPSNCVILRALTNLLSGNGVSDERAAGLQSAVGHASFP
jgi:hypothetical protein